MRLPDSNRSALCGCPEDKEQARRDAIASPSPLSVAMGAYEQKEKPIIACCSFSGYNLLVVDPANP
jgi:hypothetical protein